LEFAGLEEYTAHRMIEHLEGLDMLFPCQICNFIYTEKRWLNRHLRDVHFKFFCGLELEQDKKKADFDLTQEEEEEEEDQHQNLEGDDGKIMCYERFQTKKALVEHQWELHGVEPPAQFLLQKIQENAKAKKQSKVWKYFSEQPVVNTTTTDPKPIYKFNIDPNLTIDELTIQARSDAAIKFKLDENEKYPAEDDVDTENMPMENLSFIDVLDLDLDLAQLNNDVDKEDSDSMPLQKIQKNSKTKKQRPIRTCRKKKNKKRKKRS